MNKLSEESFLFVYFASSILPEALNFEEHLFTHLFVLIGTDLVMQERPLKKFGDPNLNLKVLQLRRRLIITITITANNDDNTWPSKSQRRPVTIATDIDK